MIKQVIKYTDYNGVQREEDFYFHLSLPEVTRLEVELGMPLDKYAKEISNDKDTNRLLAFIEKIVLNSYGKKTSDGRSFMKSPEIRQEFEYSHAYAELFEKLLTDPAAARTFGEKVADNGQAKKNQVTPTVVPTEQ